VQLDAKRKISVNRWGYWEDIHECTIARQDKKDK